MLTSLLLLLFVAVLVAALKDSGTAADRWSDAIRRHGFGTRSRFATRGGFIRLDTSPQSPINLAAMSTPTTAQAGETIAACYWDSQSYPTAGQQTTTFFNQNTTDSTLSNLQLPGTLPSPYWMVLQNVTMDWLGVPSNATAQSAGTANAGIANDLYQFLHAGRALFRFYLADKLYCEFPATGLHASGGPIVFATSTGVAATQQQFALNNVADGDLFLGGSIIIPPLQKFYATLVVQPTLPTIATATYIRIALWGSVIRRVL
jgi:hypothetical protein